MSKRKEDGSGTGRCKTGWSGLLGSNRGMRAGVSGLLCDEDVSEQRESWDALREAAASCKWLSTKEWDRSEGECECRSSGELPLKRPRSNVECAER